MKCNFCGKEINIKQEWLKKPLFNKLKDIANYYWSFDFSFSGNDKLSVGILKAVSQAVYFVVSALLLLGGAFGIFYPLSNLMDKYVFLKPLFNSTVPALTAQNTILPALSGVILLILFFYVAYLMFKSDLDGNFKKIFNKNCMSLKCPYCGKKNKLIIQYLDDKLATRVNIKPLSKKEKKNNAVLGVSIILAAIIAFIIFLSLGNNLYNFLNPAILWTIALVIAGFVALLFINKIFPAE